MKNLSTDTAEFSSIKAGDPNGLHLQDDGGNGIFIKDGGNIGIGTTNPDAKLDIFGTNSSLKFTRDVGDRSAEMVYDGSKFLIKTPAGDRLSITDASSNELLTVNPNDGHVGIGTTSPSQKLEVSGRILANGGTSEGIVSIRGGTSSNSIVEFGDSEDANIGRITYDHASDDMSIITSNITRMTIDSSGNVGIGTASPDYALSVESHTSDNYASRILNTHSSGDGLAISVVPVDSTNYILNCISANFSRFSVLSNGTAKTNGVNVSSDDRVKHNEQPIVGALETLGKITPKKYIKTSEMYDADHNFELDADGNPVDENGESVEHRIEAGVIAQQVLTVDELAFSVSPEDVDEDGKVTSPHSLDYNSLFTYAIAAIQEQQQIIEDLKSRIETLEQ